MKTTLKNLVMLITLISIPVFVMAQTENIKHATTEERAQMQTDWMQSELELDDETTSLVHDINLKYVKKMESLKTSNQSRRNKFREFKAMSDQKDAELKKVLTKEQFDLYQEKKKELKQQIRDNRR